MTKQDVIKNAYGEHWEKVKDVVTNDGFIPNWHYVQYGILDCELKIMDGSLNYRPKTLQGIEDNNGWIKIESKNDLPKERIVCWWFDKHQGEICGEFLNNGKDEVNFILANATHYQPIIKPKPPIY